MAATKVQGWTWLLLRQVRTPVVTEFKRGVFGVCRGFKCEKAETGDCTCLNVREKIKQKSQARPKLTSEEIKKRCTGCRALPCEEMDFADANCSYWLSCVDWVKKADKSSRKHIV